MLPHYRDGRFKILAVADTMRAPAIPDVPTTAEAGLPGFLSTAWFAVAGPPKLPDALAQRIAADFIEVVKMPDVAARYRAVGTEPVGSTPAQTAAFIREEIARWREVIVQEQHPGRVSRGMEQVDLRLYAIVDPEHTGGHDLVDLTRAVAAGGATLVQLRDKVIEHARHDRGGARAQGGAGAVRRAAHHQ